MMKILSTPSALAIVAAVAATSSVQGFNIPRPFQPQQQHRPTVSVESTIDAESTYVVSTTASSRPSVQIDPSFLDKALNNFQIWALQNPQNIFAKIGLPIISLVEGVLAITPKYLDHKRAMFGNNFCCAGEVVLGDFAAVVDALTQPQARTFRLGSAVLNRNHVIGTGRNLFPLSLSDPQITEEGYADGSAHADVSKLLKDHILNDKAYQRQKDDTAERLLREIAQDYKEMDHSMGGAFFTAYDRGLHRFLVRYQHYVLFGLDPDDKPTVDLLSKLYYESQGTAYFVAGAGDLLQLLNIGGAKNWPKMWEQTKEIYRNSPALSSLHKAARLLEFEYSLDELVQLLLTLLGIAALPGPVALLNGVLGGAPLPAYDGRATASIDPAVYWDQIPDLTNRTALEHHIYETGRLWAPVGQTHRVSTEDFTVPMFSSIKDESPSIKSFPAGTIILVPMGLGMLDEGFWGPNAYEYDSSRPNVCPFSMIFNSVGNRSNGRICPGKDLTMNLVVDLLRELGHVRRRL